LTQDLLRDEIFCFARQSIQISLNQQWHFEKNTHTPQPGAPHTAADLPGYQVFWG